MVFHKLLTTGCVIGLLTLTDAYGGKLLKQTSDYSVWYENPVEKVYRNDAPPEQTTDYFTVKSARNENEPFQLVIRPVSSWQNVSLEFSDLTGAGTIQKTNITYYRVEYVNITETTNKLSIGRLGWTPDPLPPETSSDLPGGQNSPFWINVFVPGTAMPGMYAGLIDIKKDGIPVERINFQLEVWDFAIPVKRCIEVFGISPGSSQFVSERRISSNFGYMGIDINRSSGVVNIDTSDFDTAGSSYINKLGNNAFIYPGTGWISTGGTHRWPSGAAWRGIPYFRDEGKNTLNPEFVNLYGQMIRKTSEYLKSKGWLKNAFVYIIDEVYDADSEEKVARIFELIKSIDPEIRIAWTGSHGSGSLNGLVSLWIIHEDLYDPVIHKEKKNAGEDYWIYNNARMLIDYHYMRVRSYLWHLWNYQIDGTEFWSMTRWVNGDPRNNPNNGGRNGDGFLLYPPKQPSTIPVISSIRLELLREGIEDYEYLCMLKTLLDQARQAGKNSVHIEMAEKALARSSEINWNKSRVRPANNEPYTKNHSLLYEVRQQIASAVLTLRRILFL